MFDRLLTSIQLQEDLLTPMKFRRQLRSDLGPKKDLALGRVVFFKTRNKKLRSGLLAVLLGARTLLRMLLVSLCVF